MECPVCKIGEVEYRAYEEEVLVCTNQNCPSSLYNDLYEWAIKNRPTNVAQEIYEDWVEEYREYLLSTHL